MGTGSKDSRRQGPSSVGPVEYETELTKDLKMLGRLAGLLRFCFESSWVTRLGRGVSRERTQLPPVVHVDLDDNQLLWGEFYNDCSATGATSLITPRQTAPRANFTPGDSNLLSDARGPMADQRRMDHVHWRPLG